MIVNFAGGFIAGLRFIFCFKIPLSTRRKKKSFLYFFKFFIIFQTSFFIN